LEVQMNCQYITWSFWYNWMH